MENVEEQILSYPHLPAAKQREVETYVENHPEWAPLLQDVRTLEAAVPAEADDRPTDALLRTYVVVQHLHPSDVPAELEAAFGRLEQKLQEDPALREQAETVRQRIETTEAAVDPVAHFETLTGRSLEETVAEDSVQDESRNPALSGADAPVYGIVDRLLQLPLALRGVGAVLALLLGVYVALFTASEASKSTLDRLAAVNVSNQVVDNYTSTATRSAVPPSDTTAADQLYVDALTAVREARTTTFGLFPSYNAEKLDQAEQRLTQVIEQTESGSFLALEAQFYLGKVRLAQGEINAARSHFRTVVKQEGRMVTEARSILETLRNEYPDSEDRTHQ